MRPTDKEIGRLLRRTAFKLFAMGDTEGYRELYTMGNLVDPPEEDDRPDAPSPRGNHGAWTGD
jgi:hypothetical protein